MRRIVTLLAGLAGLTLVGATPAAPKPPRALQGVAPGLWEVSRSATGHGGRRMCVANVADLAAGGHPGESCRRTVLMDRPGVLVLDLVCSGGDTGRSRISVTTPRSIKVELQGIHSGLPFNEALYARRLGACPRSASRR
jgi:hypothetical protein